MLHSYLGIDDGLAHRVTMKKEKKQKSLGRPHDLTLYSSQQLLPLSFPLSLVYVFYNCPLQQNIV